MLIIIVISLLVVEDVGRLEVPVVGAAVAVVELLFCCFSMSCYSLVFFPLYFLRLGYYYASCYSS